MIVNDIIFKTKFFRLPDNLIFSEINKVEEIFKVASLELPFL
jgi:hypothetical protein